MIRIPTRKSLNKNISKNTSVYVLEGDTYAQILKRPDRFNKISYFIGYDGDKNIDDIIYTLSSYKKYNKNVKPVVIKIKLKGNIIKNTYFWVNIDTKNKKGFLFNTEKEALKNSNNQNFITKQIKLIPDKTDKTNCIAKIVGSFGSELFINDVVFKDYEQMLIAHNLDIKNNVCINILSKLPPIRWQTDSYVGGPNASEYEESQIQNYTSYGYKSMNDELRFYPESKAILNDVIETLPPLPHDIRVYRYVGNVDKWLNYNNTFTIDGYLSVSYNPLSSFFIPYKHKSSAVLVINVPKGKKGIFIGGKENEIIFPHKSQFKVTKYETKQIFYIRKHKHIVEGARFVDKNDKLYSMTKNHSDIDFLTGKILVVHVDML